MHEEVALEPRRHRPLLLLLVTALCFGALPAAADDSIGDARRQREQSRAAQAQAAKQIDLLTAQDADVARALADIEEAVAAQRARVEDAAQAFNAAQAEAQARNARVAEVEAALVQARRRVGEVVVDRYVGRHADAEAVALFTASDVGQALRRTALLEYLHGTRRDAVEALRGVEAERADALAAARRAVSESDKRRADVESALAELQDRLDTQVRVRAELQRRLTDWERKQDDLEREEAQLTELIKKKQLETLKVAPTDPGAASLRGFVMPAKGALGSGFGMRMHPVFHTVRMHNGIDIGGKSGDPVVAAKEGRVIYAGWMTGFGNVTIVQHAGAVSTVYGHLSKLAARSGEWVATGEVIGLVGATGWATGPHLHFEVRVNGEPKDPLLFLP